MVPYKCNKHCKIEAEWIYTVNKTKKNIKAEFKTENDVRTTAKSNEKNIYAKFEREQDT